VLIVTVVHEGRKMSYFLGYKIVYSRGSYLNLTIHQQRPLALYKYYMAVISYKDDSGDSSPVPPPRLTFLNGYLGIGCYQ
jgi:hypothetical protein